MGRLDYLVTGGRGQLGRAVLAQAAQRGCTALSVDLEEMPLEDRAAIQRTVQAEKPRFVVHCGAITNVDGCEQQALLACRVNGLATAWVAEAAAAAGAGLVYVSTDFVFDGSQTGVPYAVDAAPRPLSVYGLSKRLGEEAVLAHGRADFYVVRTSWVFGPGGANFPRAILDRARSGQPLKVVTDQVGRPTMTIDLAEVLLDVCESKARGGIYHAANEGECSWHQFAVDILREAGLAHIAVGTQTAAELKRPAARPAWSVLDTSLMTQVRGRAMPHYQDALRRHLPLDAAARAAAASPTGGPTGGQAGPGQAPGQPAGPSTSGLRGKEYPNVSVILVTGGAGFIGSNFVRLLLQQSDHRIVNVDALTYAGNLENLKDVEHHPNYAFVRADIADSAQVEEVFAQHRPQIVVHFAAESHVDRSVLDATAFVRTNVQGTQVLLDKSRSHGVQRFVHVSTDEVYGSLGPWGYFTEETPIQANSPYSASKAGSDLLVRAAVHTHGFDCVITRCSNNYGPFQFPEKLIPLMIANALEGKPLPVYGDGKNVRDWIYVTDHCEGILAAMERGVRGEVYNFGGNAERENLYVVKEILRLLGKGEDAIKYVKDRPGHDRRYAMDSSKARATLGWEPRHTFEAGLRATIDWYVQNRAWWERVRSGAYQAYYEKQYANR